MENDLREKQQRNYNLTRTIYNITMGIIIIGIGLLVLFKDKIGLNLSSDLDPVMLYFFSGICLLYGGFRLWRGLKKER